MLVIEVFVVIIIVTVQVVFFLKARTKIADYRETLPDYELGNDFIKTQLVGVHVVEVIDDDDHDQFSADFRQIVSAINRYLIRNKGSVDFSIVENIIKRKINANEQAVASTISLPLYIGLMGTFLGIIIGLIPIAFTDEGVTDSSVNLFTGGVITAMCASFLGLLLTFWNHIAFKNAKEDADGYLNLFLNFLQVELLPHLGNSLFDALDLFKNNIAMFNSKFAASIGTFDQTFTNNIATLKSAVSSLSENVSPLIENTRVQTQFLHELRTIGYSKMAEANIRVFQLIKDSGPNFLQFIKKQNELTQSIEKALEVVKTIESIMDRIKQFENGINSLGDRLNTSDYLGAEVLVRLDRKLDHLDKQFELLEQHSKITTSDISSFLDRELSKIRDLTEKIGRALQDSPDFGTNNPLKKLHVLDALNAHLEKISNHIDENLELKGLPDKIDASNTRLGRIYDLLADNGVKPNQNPPSKSNGRKRVSRWRWISRLFG